MRDRIGLVLGAGGPAAHAVECGFLHAIELHTGWSPADAEVIVGTSAGAQVAALVRAGMSTADLYARVRRRPLSERGAGIARHYLRPPHGLGDFVAEIRPASPRYLAASLRRPCQARIGALAAALLPEGRVSLEEQAQGFERMFADGWPEAPLWIPAVDLDTGEVVVFGRDVDVGCDVGTAVAASGSVPGINEPVAVGARRFVDGSLRSLFNATVLAGAPVEVVLVLTPFRLGHVFAWLAGREKSALVGSGQVAAFLGPTRAVERVIGRDLFDTERMGEVAEAALASWDEVSAEPGVGAVLERLG